MRLIDSDEAEKVFAELRMKIHDTGIVRGISGTIDESARASVAYGVRAAKAALDSMPTVDAVPVRHCRWIQKYQPPDPKASWSTEYYCSGCGHETHMTVMPDQRDNYIDDYCGGCGARMDGGADNG